MAPRRGAHRRAAAVAVVVAALWACGGPAAEDGPDSSDEGGGATDLDGEAGMDGSADDEALAFDDESGCPDVLGGIEADEDLEAARQAFAETDLRDALAQIPSLAHVSSSFQTPSASDEFGDLERLTLFAPISAAFTERSREESTAHDEAEDEPRDDSYTTWPASAVLRAHLLEEQRLSMGELVEEESILLADGTPLEIEVENGVVTVTNMDTTAEVLCGDIEVANGFLHIIDTVLFDASDTDTEPDQLGSNTDQLRTDVTEPDPPTADEN